MFNERGAIEGQANSKGQEEVLRDLQLTPEAERNAIAHAKLRCRLHRAAARARAFSCCSAIASRVSATSRATIGSFCTARQ